MSLMPGDAAPVVPDDTTGAARETDSEKVNRLVTKYADKASRDIRSERFSEGINKPVIAASMYALLFEVGLVRIEEVKHDD